MLRQLPKQDCPDLLVGFNHADDASVMRIGNGMVLVQTLDFFTPVVDDPFDFGRIAAANALSDIYAMGGQPLMALNIVGWPMADLGPDLLAAVLKGGAAAAAEAGCTVAGGHSIDDKEPKYGMSVSAVMREQDVRSNAGARPGDRLVLTKPLGSGIITTAIKRGEATAAQRVQVTAVMSALNRSGALAAAAVGVHSITDVTGFGLLGHLAEMARASGVSARIYTDKLPLMEGVLALAEAGIAPGGTRANLLFVGPDAQLDDAVSPAWRLVVSDAQTSGGLLMAVAPERLDDLLAALAAHGALAAAVVGEVTAPGQALLQVCASSPASAP